MQATTLALVGGAHIHTPGFVKRLQARSDVRVRKVWDHEPARAQHWATELGAETAASADAIWGDAEIAAVIICSETDRHESLTKAAAQAGKHMFVEKPLGLGGADAYRMARTIDEAGVLFQTGYFSAGCLLTSSSAADHKGIRAGGTAAHEQLPRCGVGGLVTPGWTWMTDPAQAGSGVRGPRDPCARYHDVAARPATCGSIHTAFRALWDCDEWRRR